MLLPSSLLPLLLPLLPVHLPLLSPVPQPPLLLLLPLPPPLPLLQRPTSQLSLLPLPPSGVVHACVHQKLIKSNKLQVLINVRV
jgi:hypothetical protein